MCNLNGYIYGNKKTDNRREAAPVRGAASVIIYYLKYQLFHL